MTTSATNLSRQESLKLAMPKGVAIVGCGGVGTWIAYFLALAGVENLYLFDPDTVSDHNLNRLPLPATSIAKNKAAALASMIHDMRPNLDPMYTLLPFTFDSATSLSLHEGISWLVCSTDTLASRQLAAEWCRKHKVHYIEAAAEGEIGSISDGPADFATPDDANPGYASVPVWVGPCVAAAMMAVAHVLHDIVPCDGQSIRMGWSGETNDIEFYNSTPCPPAAAGAAA